MAVNNKFCTAAILPTLYDKSDGKIQISEIVMADRPNLG